MNHSKLRPKVFFILFSLLSIQMYAQSISGIVVDEQDNLVEGATVLARKAGSSEKDNSSIVKWSITGSNGTFKLKNLNPTLRYQVIIKRLGSKELKIDTLLSVEKDLDLGKVVLPTDLSLLDEITITTTKNAIVYESDKITVNIENSILKDEPTLISALKLLPGIDISASSNSVKILGKDNTEIWVNGRPTNISIESLPPSSVKRIEIINNPGARYRASSGGIINVILHRRLSKTLFAEVFTAFTQGRYFNLYDGFNTSVNTGRLSINSQFYHASNKTFLKREFTQDINENALEIYKESSEFRKIKQDYYFAYLDFNLNLENEWLLGGSIEYGKSWDPYRKITLKESFYPGPNTMAADSIYNNKTKLVNDLHELGVSGFIEKIWLKDTSELNIEVNYYKTNLEQNQDYKFNSVDQDNTRLYVLDKMDSRDANIFGIKANQYFRFDSSIGLNFGFETNFLKTGFDSNSEGANQFIESSVFSYNFEERIFAIYSEIERSFSELDIRIGGRFEHTNGDGKYLSDSNSEDLTYEYDNFFPSISVSYQLNDDIKFNAGYSKNITRPRFYDRSPFSYFISPFTIYRGNTALEPEISHYSNLDFILKKKLHVRTFYSKLHNQIATLNQPSGINSIISPRNYSFNSLGLISSSSLSLSETWKSTIKVSSSYSVSEGSYDNQSFSNKNVQFKSLIRQDITFNDWKFVITALYQTPYYLGTDKITFSPYLDIGVRKTFLGNRLDVTIDFTDVFKSFKKTVESDFQYQNSTFVRLNDSQTISLGLKYQVFNKAKNRQNKTSNFINREKARLGT